MKKICKKSNPWLNSSSSIFSIVMLFLLSVILLMPQVAALPHPIYGTATWEGGGYAVDADIEIVSSEGVLQTTVDEYGGWQVDCGDPGASWPSGTAFSICIKGKGDHTGWYGSTSDIVNDYFNDIGNIIVAPKDSSSNQSNDETSGDEEPIGENLLPVADASAGEPYLGFIDEEITFDGSQSYDWDENGWIVTWHWDFGDGTNGTGEITIHIYSKPGTYLVVLTVSDDDGAEDTYETTAVISQPNRIPSAPNVDGPQEGTQNTEYTYTAVSIDEDNDTIQYHFDWGDETEITSEFLPNGTATTQTHIWTAAGKYTITVQAYDNQTPSDTTRYTVLIDAHVVEDIGYITDDDADGTHDTFYGENIETELGQEDGKYLIDTNGDGDWNYTYDFVEGLTSYKKGEEMEIPWIMVAGIVIAIAAIASIVYFYKKRCF